MKILLFLPIAYLALLIINLEIFSASTQINFFWLLSFQVPVVIFISLFFILYILLIWAGFNFSHVFSNIKTRKLEKEVFDLKTKLLNRQWELVKDIEEVFSKSSVTLRLSLIKSSNSPKKKQQKLFLKWSISFKVSKKICKNSERRSSHLKNLW